MKVFFDTNVYVAKALLAEAADQLQALVVILEGYSMSVTVAGFVKNGVIVPNEPLPEGAFVEVRIIRGPIEVPPELQAELDAWQRANAEALELVERLAREGEPDAKG